MKYVSTFSGIEAASCAWESLGWTPVAFSEIDSFANAVLAHHYPDVPNVGDITQVDWSKHAESVDLVVGGSPCQSFSVAGTRTSLDGQSRLMFEFIRSVREIMPTWVLWENVPGALSAKGLQGESGGAFRQLLTELDDLGYGLAWRVLDAQFFGVPQRRRRVFLVGCFNHPERATEVLFEQESMCWDSPSSREKRAQLTKYIKERSGARCEYVIQGDIARGAHLGQNGKGYNDEDISYTLNTLDTPAVCMLPFNPTQITSKQNGDNPQWNDPCPPLSTSSRPPHVVFMSDGNSNAAIEEDLSGTLKVGGEPSFVAIENGSKYEVRRLTPVECERLQGFPDGWTNVEFKGKPASDTQRYKVLGNSIAVPVLSWIGERIEKQTSYIRGR